MNVNKVQIVGRVTSQIEVKQPKEDFKVANFSIASNRTWKNGNGEKQEETEFHNIVAFGKIAETIGKYVIKGQELYVEGRLKTRNWEKDGQKFYRTEIIAENFQFGQKPKGSEGGNYDNQQQEEYEQQHPKESGQTEEINIEDIPF